MLKRLGGSRHITMPNFLETGPLTADILQFFDFSNGPAAILYFWSREILSSNEVQRVEAHQRAKYCQNLSIGFDWIRLGHIWTTHSKYLGVSISLQNLVVIDAVVFRIWTFQYLAHLAGIGWKMPIHAQKMGFFGQFDPLNGLQYQPKPKKAHPCVSLRYLSH